MKKEDGHTQASQNPESPLPKRPAQPKEQGQVSDRRQNYHPGRASSPQPWLQTHTEPQEPTCSCEYHQLTPQPEQNADAGGASFLHPESRRAQSRKQKKLQW